MPPRTGTEQPALRLKEIYAKAPREREEPYAYPACCAARPQGLAGGRWGSAVLGFTGRENTAKNQKENTVKKIRKRYRLGTLVAVIFLAVCALLASGMPGASAASTAAQGTSSPMTTVKFADSAFGASAAMRSTPPHGHPRDADACTAWLEPFYEITPLITAACTAGAATYPGPAHIGLGIAYAVCGGLLGWAGVLLRDAAVACTLAPIAGIPFTSTQWCGPNSGNDCLNAWSGGPWVDVYTGGPETGDTHQHFMVIDENGNQNSSEIVYTGSGSYSGECIGDAYNNSGYADTSLDACGLPGQSAGWGTQMTWGTSGCPSGEAWFHDNHWNGYLAPANGAVNGSHFYLNDQTKTCFALVLDT